MFLPWKETGFTEEMVLGGKKIYHADDWEIRTKNKHNNGIQMQLWTVINKEIFVEISPDWDEFKLNKDLFDWWAEHINLVIKHGKMP